jgi:hypothetical protein
MYLLRVAPCAALRMIYVHVPEEHTVCPSSQILKRWDAVPVKEPLDMSVRADTHKGRAGGGGEIPNSNYLNFVGLDRGRHPGLPSGVAKVTRPRNLTEFVRRWHYHMVPKHLGIAK